MRVYLNPVYSLLSVVQSFYTDEFHFFSTQTLSIDLFHAISCKLS